MGPPARIAREGALVFALLLGAIVATAGDYALTWDEPYYFAAQEQQRKWFAQLVEQPGEALSAAAIDRGWNAYPYHNPHPPFYKAVSNLTRVVLGGVLDPFTAHRVASGAFFAGAGAVLYAFVRRARDPLAAAAAVALWATTPPIFAHGHYAATDTPMTFFAVATCYAFTRAVGGTGAAPIVALGLLLGAAFATKFTAVLLPVPLAAWTLLHRRWRGVRVLALAALVAVPTAIALVPYWWHDPVGGIWQYARSSTGREHASPISVIWGCRIYDFRAPVWYPWAMLAVATPLTLWLPAVARIVQVLRRRLADEHASLLLLAFFVPMAVVTLPSSPKHDGLRMFLPCFPFLAALAGEGLLALVGALGAGGGASPAPVVPRRTQVLLVVAAAIAQASATIAYHPYQLEYYNTLVGGLAGARRAGLEVSFWMEGFTPEVLRGLEGVLPEGALIGLPTGDPTYFRYQQARGRLRPDLAFRVDDGRQPFVLVTSRLSYLGCGWMADFERAPARFELRVDGVRVVGLYDRAALGAMPPLGASGAERREEAIDTPPADR